MHDQHSAAPEATEPAGSQLLTTDEAAEIAGLDPKSLKHQRWRGRRGGWAMPYEIVGGRPMYRLSTVLAHYREAGQ